MRRHNLLLFALALPGLLAPTDAAAREKWRPVTPEELSQSAPKVEPGAGAEAIFWDRTVEDDVGQVDREPRIWTTTYLRIKVLDERGKKSLAQIDLEYDEDSTIDQVMARTIRPDGSIVELAKDAVFERSIVKAGRTREVKARSFAPPALEVGCLVEYQWRTLERGSLSSYVVVPFQRDVPVQKASYTFTPLQLPGFGVRTQTFRCTPTPFVKSGDAYTTTVSGMAAYHDEPWMIPDLAARSWLLVYYTDQDKGSTPDTYWKELSKKLYSSYRSLTKPNGDIRKLAEATVGKLTDPEARLRALWDVARAKVKPIRALSSREKEKRKANEDPADTLERGVGTAGDVDDLFAALARGAGFEVRLGRAPNRGVMFFNPSLANAFFLPKRLVAVRVGETWRYFSPGDRSLPFGSLRWQQQSVSVLRCEEEGAAWDKTPVEEGSSPTSRRSATLRLLPDGTVEGKVRSELSSQSAMVVRDEEVDRTADQRVESLKKDVAERLPGVELTNVSIEGLDDPARPLVYTYDVKVPGYALRTGTRLLASPSFFRKGLPPRFLETARRHPIYVPWTERAEDAVTLELPAGFTLEDRSWPEGFPIGDAGTYASTLQVAADGRSLTYTRRLSLAAILFPETSYPALKRVFDAVHERDGQTLSLKETP